LTEINDERANALRYIALETFARVADKPTVRLPAAVA
jgi:hypothetical protein